MNCAEHRPQEPDRGAGPMASNQNDESVSYRAEIEALDRLGGGFRVSARHHLKLWLIRWAIGFGLIAIVVHMKPDWSWLWWWGAAFALALPAATLAANALLGRKIRRVQRRYAELEDLVERLDEAPEQAES